jgi:hypothetical protein
VDLPAARPPAFDEILYQQLRTNPNPTTLRDAHGPVTGIAPVTFPHRLPRPELRTRQITPRNAGAVPIDDAFHYSAVITERMTPPTRVRRQQARNQFPLPLLTGCCSGGDGIAVSVVQ